MRTYVCKEIHIGKMIDILGAQPIINCKNVKTTQCKNFIENSLSVYAKELDNEQIAMMTITI